MVSFNGRTVLPFNASQAGDPADFEYRNTGQDMTFEEVIKLTNFVAALPRPTERPRATDTVRDVTDGESLFRSVGCSVCHVADLRPATGIFSDLLLHDMGLQLQSPMPAPLGSLTAMLHSLDKPLGDKNSRRPGRSCLHRNSITDLVERAGPRQPFRGPIQFSNLPVRSFREAKFRSLMRCTGILFNANGERHRCGVWPTQALSP